MAITAIAILMAGALASVTAQVGLPPIPIGSLSGTYKMAMDANELSAGDTKFALAETYGWTCYGETSGDLNGFMFVSMNYALPNSLTSVIDGKVGISPPLSKVTGGSWSKLIFIKGKYLGSVHGRIVGGTLEWSKTDLSAKMKLELSADGGTGAFVDNVGKGTFEGALEPSQKEKGGRVTGALVLDY